MRKRIVTVAATLTLALALAAPGHAAHAASKNLTCSVAPKVVAPFHLTADQYAQIVAAPAGTTEVINGYTVVKVSAATVTPVLLTVNGTAVTLTCR